MRGSKLHWASERGRGAWLALALLLPCAGARADESLCAAGEPVVFSCHIGNKTLSLCRPSALRQELVYRFGTPNRVELAWPGPGRHALAGEFTLDTRPLYGGGITTVSFDRGEYRYSVYSKMARGEGPARAPEFEDGIIISRRGKQVRQLVCDDGGEGFREELGWLPKARR